MAIYKGNTQIVKIYKGSTPITRKYKGTSIFYNETKLPSAFQEVEYISASGTQYIDTTYIPTNNTKVEMACNFDSVDTAIMYHGVADGTGKQVNFGVNGISSTQIGKFLFSVAVYSKSITPSDTSKHLFTIDMQNMYCAVDSTTESWADGGQQLGEVTHSFTIFGKNGSSMLQYVSGKVYYCKFYDSGVLTHNFIPCYRKADNVIGLYDTIDGIFYTNAGSGTFGKGSDV